MEINPLFIVGAARSGTSYLHSLLNCHPRIRLSYESGLPLEGCHLYNEAKALHTRTGFNSFLDSLITLEETEDKNRWLCQSIAANRVRLFSRHTRHHRFQDLVRDIFQLASPVALSCFGNKMLRAELCPDIERAWPQSKFIVLVRDPRAVVASQLHRFRGRRLPYAAIYANAHMIQALEVTQSPSNYLRVSYESLVRDPKNELSRILAFSGLPDPFYLSPMLAKRPPHKSSMEKWRRTLSQSQIKRIESYCFNSMIALGYTPELAAGQEAISAIKRGIEVGYEKRGALFLHPKQWRQKKLIQRFFKIINL